MRSIAKAAAVIVIAVLPNWAYAGVEVAACCDSRGYCGYAVGSSWNDSLNGTRYLCKCTSGGGTCSPTSSGGSSGGSYGGSSSGGGGSSKDLWKYQMMQGIVGGLMQGLMQGLENQQRAEAQRAEQQRQQQEAARLEAELQRQKTEAEKRAAKEAWENKRKEAAMAEKRRKEEEARDAANLAAKMGSGGGLVLVPMGGTNFFGSKSGSTTLELKSIGKGENDAANLSALQRAVCSSQFMSKAAHSGSDEEGRYYSNQAEQVMSGGKYNEVCDLSEGLPDVPKAPVPEPLWSPEEMAFFKKVEEVSVQMQEKALQIQEIEAKVVENKEKIDDAKAKKEQADAILKDLQSKAASTDDPAKKAEIDTLLAEANALLSEAENDSLTAQQENEQLLSDKQKIEQSMQETKKMLEAQIPKPQTTQGAEDEKR